MWDGVPEAGQIPQKLFVKIFPFLILVVLT